MRAMASDYAFAGMLEYADAASLKRAVRAARELLDEEDEGLADLVRGEWARWFRADGAKLHVAVDFSGSGDDWFALEAVVETLAGSARGGHVDGTHEEAGRSRYHPGGESEDLDD
jgi:hypothetical protein